MQDHLSLTWIWVQASIKCLINKQSSWRTSSQQQLCPPWPNYKLLKIICNMRFSMIAKLKSPLVIFHTIWGKSKTFILKKKKNLYSQTAFIELLSFSFTALSSGFFYLFRLLASLYIFFMISQFLDFCLHQGRHPLSLECSDTTNMVIIAYFMIKFELHLFLQNPCLAIRFFNFKQ